MNKQRLAAIALAICLWPAVARAQVINVQRVNLTGGPCVIRGGSGNPEGSITGNVCDVFIRSNGSANGTLYVKSTGTGNTGWVALAGLSTAATFTSVTTNSGGLTVPSGQGLEFGAVADTAIYGTSASDTISFYTGGSERMKLITTAFTPASAGSINLGTVLLPWGASFAQSLQLAASGSGLLTGGTGAAASLDFQAGSNTTTSTTPFSWKAGNNGATTLASLFSGGVFAVASGTTPVATSLGSGGVFISAIHNTASGGFQAATNAVANGTDAGYTDYGTLGTAGSEKRAGAIHAFLSADSTTVVTGELRFYTTAAGTIGEKLRILSTGVVCYGGGGSSSFPGIKRNGTSLQVRLCDDSAFGSLQAFQYQAEATGFFYFNGQSSIRSSSNGRLNFENAAQSAGVTLDFSTDAVAKLRNRADSAFGTHNALAYLLADGARGLASSGSATALLAPDGGAYFLVSNGNVDVNSANLRLQTGGSTKFGIVPDDDGQVIFKDSAGTHGVLLDVTTDALMKVRNRGDSAEAGIGAAYLKFPATQAPSTDVNELDDYEEGSWTPVIGGSGGTSGQTYTAQVGRYVKVGKQVCVQGTVTLSAKGTITSAVQIQGLPFTSENTSLLDGTIHLGYWASTVTSFVHLSGIIAPNTTVADMYGATAATTGLGALVTGDIGNSTDFRLSGCYRATQ